MNRVFLFGAVAMCALLYCAMIVTRRAVPLVSGLSVATEGRFIRDGQYPGEAFEHAPEIRVWGSWAGSDENNGSIRLGPFPAPPVLTFAIGGYPNQQGLDIYLESAKSKVRQNIETFGVVGERWRTIQCMVPTDWVDAPVSLVARDANKNIGGWIALSEPFREWKSAKLVATLAAWGVNALLFTFLWYAGLELVGRNRWVAAEWQPLAAAGLVAVAGYMVFWIYFASPTFGKITSLALLAYSIYEVVRQPKIVFYRQKEAFSAGALLLGLSFLYICLLNLFPSSLEFYAQAANRWGSLPGDNTLPYNVSFDLFRGRNLRWPGADWLSSDRPPLQSGWQLLTWLLTTALRLDERTASGTASVLFQSLWVFAVYGLLRTLGISRWRTLAWTLLLGLSGFLVLNTVYTWPKLSAAAFACGAFCLWLFPASDAKPTTSEYAWGGVLAALGWLSHGGVAFSFLALVPFVAWRLWGNRRGWTLAAAAFAVLCVPWLLYQKFYDPPGNRLLKWHLAGQIAKDSRPTLQTIRDSYTAASWTKLIDARLANLRFQVSGHWSWWRDLSYQNAATRRFEESAIALRTPNWFLVGLAALPLALARRRTCVRWRHHAALSAWMLGTIVIWCLLMFIPGSAMNHQGSYADLLVLLVLLSAWIDLAVPWGILPVGLLQALSFATTWAVSNERIRGPIVGLAVSLSCFALFCLWGIVGWTYLAGCDNKVCGDANE